MKSKLIVLIVVGAILVCALLFIPRKSSDETGSGETTHEIGKPNNVVNGAEFHVVTDPVWQIPKPGEETRIKIGLSFKNRSKGKMFFSLEPYIAIRPILTNSNGETIPIEGGSSGEGKTNLWSRCLDPGESYEFLYPDACLSWSWSNQGKELCLYLIRGPRTWLYFPGLSPGNYSISFHYERRFALSPVEGVSAWVGEAITPPVKVEIK
jgi:hypothetical protein